MIKLITEGVDQKPDTVFDVEYCSHIDENEKLQALQKNPWDTYRDLNKVVSSKVCLMNKIGLERILLIDSDAEKIQGFLNNTLQTSEYSADDVLG